MNAHSIRASLALSVLFAAVASRPAAAAPCDAAASSVAYAPAMDTFGVVAFEDNWPAKGDLDFNDENIGYNFIYNQTTGGKISSIQVTLAVLSVGAQYLNGLYLHLPVASDAASSILLNIEGGAQQALTPVAGEPELVLKIANNTRDLFGGASGFINTDPTLAPIGRAEVNLIIQFAAPLALAPADAPYDLYIARTGDEGHQIHRPAYAGTTTMSTALFHTVDDGSTPTTHFITTTGLPFALTIPEVFAWPSETVAIERVYPDIVAFASSGGTQHTDWYLTNAVASLTWMGNIASTPAAPTVIGPALPQVCPPPPPNVCSGGNDPQTGSPWIVCRSDANTTWVSANNGGFYHVTEICKQLGYNNVIAYGGTCGNVCGYCESATSCGSNGREVYDGAGGCSFDANGLIICYTVMWECMR